MNDKSKVKNYEIELPDGYEAALTLDVTNKRFGLIMNLAAAVLSILITVLSAVIIFRDGFSVEFKLTSLLVFTASLAAYIVLHELLHGLAYKLLTKHKLKFGLTFSAAYCGVPDIYVYRRASLVALLTPFVVFSLVFLAFAFFLRDKLDRFLAALLFALHIGGCSGDLYMTFLFLTRFKDGRTLTRDTGPAATFYLPTDMK